MKRTMRYILPVFIFALLLSGCTPGLGEDSFETIDIFDENHTFTFERTEGDDVNDIQYTIETDGNIVKTGVEIDFSEGGFTSNSEFHADTLLPIRSFKSNRFNLDPDKNWEITADYGENLQMVARTETEQESKSMDLPAYYLDNEGLLFTMGALKYEEGFSQVINISIIDAGEIIPFRVTYLGVETVEVPYGNVQCIKVEMKYTGLVLGPKPKMYMWYTADENRYPVLYENKDVKLALKSID